MIDKKQAEEMTRDINNAWSIKPNGDIFGINEKLNKYDIEILAYQLVLSNYQKIPENAVIMTKEELHEIEENAYQVGVTLGKQTGGKETATNILKGLSSTKIKICNDYYIFAENINVLAKHYDIEVDENESMESN